MGLAVGLPGHDSGRPHDGDTQNCLREHRVPAAPVHFDGLTDTGNKGSGGQGQLNGTGAPDEKRQKKAPNLKRSDEVHP